MARQDLLISRLQKQLSMLDKRLKQLAETPGRDSFAERDRKKVEEWLRDVDYIESRVTGRSKPAFVPYGPLGIPGNNTDFFQDCEAAHKALGQAFLVSTDTAHFNPKKREEFLAEANYRIKSILAKESTARSIIEKEDKALEAQEDEAMRRAS